MENLPKNHTEQLEPANRKQRLGSMARTSAEFSPSYEEIDNKLQSRLTEIFKEKDVDSLSTFEKRKTIYNYLIKNTTYDHELLKNLSQMRNIVPSKNQLINAIFQNKGICNSLSQYYELLLERVGVISYSVFCNNGSKRPHVLNIVRNDDDTYSFDDVSSAVFFKNIPLATKVLSKQFFNYDLKKAHSLGQGNRPVGDYLSSHYQIYADELVYRYINQKGSLIQKPKLNVDDFHKITVR